MADFPEVARTDGAAQSLPSGVLLAAGAWWVGRLVVGVAWAPTRDPFSFAFGDWTRVDSFNYLSIARHGSTFGYCARDSVARYFHQTYCGTAAWLPGYPLVVGTLHRTGLDLYRCAQLVSLVAFGAALFLVWWGWCRELSRRRAFLVLCLVAVFPGAVYDFALFPLSLALACIVGALLASTRDHSLVAALLMAAAGLCYPSAWFAAAGLAVGLFVVGLGRSRREAVRRGLWGLAGLGSLVLLGFYDYLAVNRFDAYFVIQNQPGAQVGGGPGQAYWDLVVHRNNAEQVQLGRFGGAMLAVEAVVAPLVWVAGAVSVVLERLRRRAEPRDLYALSVGLGVTLCLVLISNPGAWNRSIALAAPGAVCLRKAPIVVLAAAVLVAGATTALASRSFFAFTGL